MTFQASLNHHFPGAITEADFVERTWQAVQPHGFTSDSAIACVSVCRDERTQPLIVKIYDKWGEAFNFSSLAGMLFLGTTGFMAAYQHAPHQDGRERYVHFALAHIAIGDDGQIGHFYRPGREAVSGACGALMAFHDEMTGGHLNLDLNPDDVEQSLLKHRLFQKIRYGETPNLISLTHLAHESILEDLERMISLTVDTNHSDYAVFTGIQIHRSDGHDFVWPGILYAVVKGQRHDISL